jgi:hypothetical protein
LTFSVTIRVFSCLGEGAKMSLSAGRVDNQLVTDLAID